MRTLMTAATFLAALPLAAALAAPLAKVDETFIKKAAIGGMTEISEGQAALTASSNPDVKSFAQKMVDAHTANDKALADLASSKGVTVPSDLDKKHSQQVDSLTKKTGAAFDTAYLKAQVKDHSAMEKVMQNEIDKGEDADLKAFATKTLPVVQDHLGMAKAIKTGKAG